MLHTLSISALRQQLANKTVSAVEVATHFLARIEAQKDLNAFINIDSDATLAQARDRARDRVRRAAEAASVTRNATTPRRSPGSIRFLC